MKQNFFEVVKLIEIFVSENWLTSNANYSFGPQWSSDVSMVNYSLIALLSKSVKTFLRKIARKFAICHSLKWFYKVNWANFAFVLFWRNFFQFLRKNRDSKIPPFSTLCFTKQKFEFTENSWNWLLMYMYLCWCIY